MAFLAPVHSRFGSLPRFALWVTGSTGDGKTFTQSRLQDLYIRPQACSEGSTIVSMTSTVSYMRQQAYFAKDGLLVFDDYKQVNTNPGNRHELCQFLSNIHDATSRGALNANRQVGTLYKVRCLILCNGEDAPPIDAGIISRLLIQQFPKRERNFNAGKALTDLSSQTSSIMPTYINWFLNQDIEKYRAYFQEGVALLLNEIKGMQNDARISANESQIRLGYKLLTDFAESIEVFSKEESRLRVVQFDEVLKRHTQEMANRVSSV